VGIAGLTLATTGLLLWLLGGGSWRAWVTIRKGGARRFNFYLHRVSGLWSLLFIAVISFTGIGLSYPQALRDAWERATGQPASIKAPKLRGAAARQTRSLDELITASLTAMPDAVPMELRIPDSPTSAVSLRMRRAGDLSTTGSNRVYLDGTSGKVLSTDRAAEWPLGVRFMQALAPVHYAEIGGLPVRILWSFLGATPALLFVTGLLVWWRPKQKTHRKIDTRVREAVEEDSVAEAVRR
jgi:uncharacterized iron-regulated membrane protein